MSTDKILQKIQIRIGGISETMQVFAEDTIHPTVSDCDLLRNQMNELLEQLAVYKFHMQNAELSPSFNLHAKVSEKIADIAVAPAPSIPSEQQESVPEVVLIPEPLRVPEPSPAPIAKIAPEPAQVMPEPKNELPAAPIAEKTAPRAALAVGLNDKFRFINELFAQNSSEYNIAIEQFNSLQSWADTELFLNSLKAIYGWKESNESVKYFYSLVRKRFNV